jgi:hypothetical protein
MPAEREHPSPGLARCSSYLSTFAATRSAATSAVVPFLK